MSKYVNADVLIAQIEGLHNYLFAGHDFSGAAAAERCKLFVENNPGVDLDFSSFLAAKEKRGDKEV